MHWDYCCKALGLCIHYQESHWFGNDSWWRHQMETFSALLAICAQRPVTRSFDVFFDVRLIKRLSKHSRGWWFETLSHPLWRHRNVTRVTKWGVTIVTKSVDEWAQNGYSQSRKSMYYWIFVFRTAHRNGCLCRTAKSAYSLQFLRLLSPK